MKLLEVKEGSFSFYVPHPQNRSNIPRRSDVVFFNPEQEINRDFSVLALRAYAKLMDKTDLSICEPLCGTGIRSCRYSLESPVSSIFCNDLNARAIELTQRNISRLPNPYSKLIHVYRMECNDFLRKCLHEGRYFDVVDIDPYGSPVPYLQNAIHASVLKGLLAFTATDLATLVGVYPQALYARYGTSHFDTRLGNVHELAMRLFIAGVQQIGLRLNQSIVPILAFYHRHFIRVFFLRKRGVTQALKNLGFIHGCKQCTNRYSTYVGDKIRRCISCGSSKTMSVGPIFLGMMQQKAYLETMQKDSHIKNLGTQKHLTKLLSLMLAEQTVNVPWSFEIERLAKKYQTRVPSTNLLIEKLREHGYSSTQTQFSGTTIKTEAPETEIREILQYLVNPR
jgi:tRNA (guanine26-N2/guanine27-N2)-dimethyltransferase